MHFEANPLSLQLPRSAQDGDAGDARYNTPSQQRRDPSSFPFKSSLRDSDNISGTETQQHGGGYNTQMHQSGERVPSWQAGNNNDYDNDMAGGEDVYSGGGGNNKRVHHTLTKYSRISSDDEYNRNNNNSYSYSSSNNNVSNNYSVCNNSNSLNCNNSYVENEDNNIIKDNIDGLEQRPIPIGLDLQGPTKVSEFQSMQIKTAAVTDSKMDYITLAGFLLGYLTSNVLFSCAGTSAGWRGR